MSNLIDLDHKAVVRHSVRKKVKAPDLDLRKPARPEWAASSIRGVTIFSVMSVRTVNVGTTMKSMKPGHKTSHKRSAAVSNPVTALTPPPHVYSRRPRYQEEVWGQVGVNRSTLCCSPIWDWATMVDFRSHSGEKGSPSSASLSPWMNR